MAYSKQNFQDGQILNAANLEKMENGIIAGQGAKNLLVNSDFRNPINSNNQTSYSGAIYGIDKWFGNSDSTVITIVESGITVTGDYLVQRLDKDYIGKILTVCAMDANKDVAVATCTVPEATGYQWLCTSYSDSRTFVGIMQTDTGVLRINTVNSNGIGILWIALYEGAYTIDTLPDYLPKEKRQEMSDCGIPLYPRNLLINSNFQNPINSNGKSSYSSTVETIDKWIGNSTTTTVSIVENQGITFTSNSSYNLLKQDFSQGSLAGKVLTLVIWDSTNKVFFGSGTYPSAGSATTVYYDSIIHLSFDARYGTDAVRIGTVPDATSNITIKHVALYEGAYTKDMLPNYIPKSNSIELFDCGLSSQPYNLIINGNFRKNAFIASDGLNATAYLGNNWLGHASITATQNDLNLKLTSSSQYSYITQKIAVEVGKAYTFVVKTPSVSSAARIAIYNSDISSTFGTKTISSSDKITILTAVPTSSPITCLFYPGFTADGGNSTIEYAALYEGAYSFDTLPIYVPYPKQVEMMRCGMATQPENLLKNSDFTNVINSKGLSSYEGQVEGIDGWTGRVVAQKVEVESANVKITATGTVYAAIKQKVAKIPKLVGKTITFAAKLYSNVDADIRIADADENMLAYSINPAGKMNILIVNYTVPSGATEDSVVPTIMLRTIESGNYIRLYWAALYEGIYDAATLPAYVPKGNHNEMLNCNISLTPHNLLDNSNFRNPINQRGITSVTTDWAYILDRWYCSNVTSDAPISINTNGLTLNNTNSTNTMSVREKVPNVKNGSYTIAAKANGMIGTYYFTLENGTMSNMKNNTNDIWKFWASVENTNTVLIFLQAFPGKSATFEWAALYEGTYTIDTLPTYQPKDYTSELMTCRYYYQVIPEQTSVAIASTSQGSGYYGSSIIYPKMRIAPTITYTTDSNGYIGVVQNVGFVSDSEFAFIYKDNGVLVPYTTNANYAGKVMSLYALKLSADL